MPDITTYTTKQLMDALQPFIIHPTAISLLNELKAREIKSGDADDDSTHRGGNRPTHQPLNP